MIANRTEVLPQPLGPARTVTGLMSPKSSSNLNLHSRIARKFSISALRSFMPPSPQLNAKKVTSEHQARRSDPTYKRFYRASGGGAREFCWPDRSGGYGSAMTKAAADRV